VRFSGYDVSALKIFVFCLAAAFSGIGGAMFVLQVGFISPSLVGIVPSIEMVIFAALGGKGSLYGAVIGALVVNTGKSLFSENFPQLWLFCMGGLFIFVVVLFPNGVAGGLEQARKRWGPWLAALKARAAAGAGAAASAAPLVAPTPAKQENKP
jgi:urea transport system permease protein